MAKLPSKEELDALEAALQPYYTAVGKVAHSWNHLHEELGKVFCAVTGLDISVGMPIWHGIRSDGSQREMLGNVTAARSTEDDWAEQYPDALAEIRWLLKKIGKVAGKRNDAIHAPCFPIPGDNDFEIRPLTFFRNRLAQRLLGKDILKEFERYVEFAGILRQHTKAIRFAIDARTTWPERPQLPNLELED